MKLSDFQSDFVFGQQQQYKPLKLISEGGFGSVWSVAPKGSTDENVWVSKFGLQADALTTEIDTVKFVHKRLNEIGGKLQDFLKVPRMPDSGSCKINSKTIQYMVMERFGKDLSHIRNMYFSNELNRIYAVLRAGLTILKGLYVMHVYLKLVHGDIKPQNFLFENLELRSSSTDKIVFIDLGLTRKLQEKPVRTSGINGTRSFASIHVHKKYLPTPRCDIESLCYMLLHFIDHQLPWNKRLKDEFPKNMNGKSERAQAKEKAQKEQLVLIEKRALKERISSGRFASQGELILADLFYAVFHMHSVPDANTYKALCRYFYLTLRKLQSFASSSSSSSGSVQNFQGTHKHRVH